MMGKRKRSRPSAEDSKRAKVEKETITSVKHPALGLYYRSILTLRDYLLSRLPTTSKSRRRKLLSTFPGRPDIQCSNAETSTLSEDGQSLYKLLNNTLVCTIDEQPPRPISPRIKDFEVFSQHLSLTAGSDTSGSTSSLSDLVDFAIWLLFNKIHRHAHRPPHMLCHGFQRASNPRQPNEDHCAVAGIPGIVPHYPNANVNVLKASSWTEILGLLGKEGDSIMIDLFLDCGVFVAGDENLGNFYQLSGRDCAIVLLLVLSLSADAGTPLTELNSLNASKRQTALPNSKPEICNTSASCQSLQSAHKNPAAITFVRNRMFYARAALNAKGRVSFGLRHIRQYRRSTPQFTTDI